jgi:hypothetical protein
MPCMYNGQPVKGNRGACPYGSTWVEDGQATVSEPSNNKLFRDSKIFGNWFDPKNYTDLKNWSENLQGYIDEKPSLSKIDNSMNEFFTKMGFNKSATKNDGLTEQQKLLMAGGSDSGRRGRATLNPQHKSRHGGEFKPTMMKKLTNNMKDPKWWHESISGLPSDTRLMRLGQLMNYYGKTPKGRQASDDPSKLWAANEVASDKIQAAKDAAANKTTKPTSVLSKLGGEELDAAIRPLVEKQLGYSDFIPLNQASSDEVDRDVALVKTLVQQYHTVDGMPINEAIDKAVKQVKNTNIPVLPFF